MSKGTSPWSVVGALLVPSRKRKEKAKKAEAALQRRSESRVEAPSTVTKAEETPKKPEATEEPEVEKEPEIPPEEPTSDIKQPEVDASASGGSSSEDILSSEAAGAEKVPSEKDQEWTDVAPHQDASPSPELSEKQSSSPVPFPPEDDVVDVMSPSESASAELLEQRDAVHDELRAMIEQREAEILALHDDKRELEGRLADVADELAGAGRRNEELSETNQHQSGKISSLESAIRALDEEMEAARTTEANMREELERSHGRAKGLEDENRRQADEIQQSEGRLEDALKELDTIEAGLQDLGEHNHRLLERVEFLEDTVQSLTGEKFHAESREKALQSELEEVRERFHALENYRHEQSLKIEGLENDKATTLTQLKEDRAQSSHEIEALRQNLKLLEADKADLLAGLEGAMQRHRELEGHVAHHINENYTKEAQLQEVQENYATVTTQIQAALESAIRQNEEIQNQTRRQAEERRTLEQQIQDLKAQADMTKQPNQRQLERFERQNRMLLDQIRRQSESIRRPRLAQASPPLERTLREDMDVMALVKKLNLEIFQTAAHMADSLTFTGAKALPAHRTKGVIERAILTMGRPMVLALGATSNQTEPDFNPLPIQFGLQGCLVRCCARIITSWYPGHWEYGEFLATIYSRIQESGSKIASKWRAVTQAQIKQPLDNELHTSMRGFLQANLVDALIVAGWYDSQSAAQETFASFRERLTQIVKLALRLNLAVGEDWENIVIYPNERFEPEIMENAYDGEDLEDVQYVVCTTGMGLKSVVGETVIKPQVILRTTLREETGYNSFE